MKHYGRAAGVPSTFTKWRDPAAYRDKWRVLCGAKARGTVHTPPKHPRDIWVQVVDGPPPSNTAHPTTAPTRPRRQQPRTPAPTPEPKAEATQPASSRTPVGRQTHNQPRRPRVCDRNALSALRNSWSSNLTWHLAPAPPSLGVSVMFF